jgi:hypothetical protein
VNNFFFGVQKLTHTHTRSQLLSFVWISRLSNCFECNACSRGHSSDKERAIGFASVKILFPDLARSLTILRLAIKFIVVPLVSGGKEEGNMKGAEEKGIIK